MRWIVADPQIQRAEALGAAIGVRSLTAQLLINRGIVDVERAKRYLEPRLGDLRRPDGDLPMGGFARALERLERAIVDGERVGVYGDYDADGVTSCAVLTSFLRGAGVDVVPRVASRDAGYGFTLGEVAAFAEAACKLVVTCDLGTSDHESLADARKRGIDVIIVDHHQVPDRDPEAYALINPHQPSCLFPFKGLASVGVAFYLAAALRTRLRDRGRTNLADPRELLDLVAIGTIGDLAPLTDENRVLVRAGLRLLSEARRPGIRALVEVSGLTDGVRGAADVGFRLGPRLNAPGRLGEARLALELLLAPTIEEARRLAGECDRANQKRQSLQERVVDEAIREAELQRDDQSLVVAGHGWHHGVVGIVAAKLVERYRKPTLVISLEGGTGRGSGRTVKGVNLYLCLKACAEILPRYGGHAAACGLSIEARNVDELKRRFEEAVRKARGDGPNEEELSVDAEVTLDEIDERLAGELERLEPFGIGNPEPILGMRGILLESSRVVGDKHLQVTFKDSACAVSGIGFHFAAQQTLSGARVRAAVVPGIDTYRGERRLRVRLKDLAAE